MQKTIQQTIQQTIQARVETIQVRATSVRAALYRWLAAGQEDQASADGQVPWRVLLDPRRTPHARRLWLGVCLVAVLFTTSRERPMR
jgi:hypothetical protein